MDRLAKSPSLSTPAKLSDDDLAAVAGASGSVVGDINVVVPVNVGVNVGNQIAVLSPGVQQSLGQLINSTIGVSIGH